LNSVGSAVGWL